MMSVSDAPGPKQSPVLIDVRLLRRAMIVAGVVLIVAAALLTVVSVSSTQDTPCGSLLSPEFGAAQWNTDTQCGLVYVGTLVISVVLALTGSAVLLLASPAGIWPARPVMAWWLLVTMCAIAVIAAISLAVRAGTWSEPVVGRGWKSLRNLAIGVTALMLVVLGLTTTEPPSELARRSNGRSAS